MSCGSMFTLEVLRMRIFSLRKLRWLGRGGMEKAWMETRFSLRMIIRSRFMTPFGSVERCGREDEEGKCVDCSYLGGLALVWVCGGRVLATHFWDEASKVYYIKR